MPTFRAIAPKLSSTVFLLAACTPTSEVADAGDGTTTATTAPTSDEGSSTGDTGGDESTGEPAACGDGIVQDGEECDDGPDNADDAACKSDCTAAFCGDGVVQTGVEECDDGNDDNTDGCTDMCMTAVCGDGIVQDGEDCDDANDDNDDGCTDQCTAAPLCGDGVVQTGEACDDGNDDNNDACTELCAPPSCGDGFQQTVNAELCDDGDMDEGDECNADCMTAGVFTDTYNGAADNNDVADGVAFDSGGNVIVVGSSLVTNQNDNIWIRKYDPSGNVSWTETYHDLTSDLGHGVAVASNDDIFVVGSVYTAQDGRDIWVRRYSSSGSGGWIQTANGSADGADEALGVAVDPSDNVLVTGYASTNGGRDIWIRKYSSSGSTTWTRTAAGAGGNNDEGHAIASDGAGNVYVTGHVWAGSDMRDIWVRKYNASGSEQWTQTHDGPAGENDEGNGIAVDSGGNVIVAGYETTANEEENIWIRKYDPDGNEIWTSTHNAPQDSIDIAHAVAVDSLDQIVVAGSVYRGAQEDNVWVRKHDPDGNEIWTSTYNSDGFGSDVAQAVAVDADDNVAAAGFETRSDLGETRNVWVRLILQ